MASSSSSLSPWRAVVAIPVKNEAERIVACLRALAAQRGLGHGAPAPFDVLLYVNNSDDGTAALAAALAPELPFALDVLVATLPPEDASAGGARRRAMALAADRLDAVRPHGLLFTTDADSRVPPEWIARAVAAIDAGADAVAGRLALDPDEEARLPAALKARGALEARYEALVCEIESRLDPRPYDPWPCHPTESGASFALTLESFRAVGGVPAMALGEDRALADALRRAGFRIRHAPEITVVTSGRLQGRAEGGCADTMRRRIEEPEARCDPYLRPVWQVVLDHIRPPLAPRANGVAPRDLPAQIRRAEALLAALRAGEGLRVGNRLDPRQRIRIRPQPTDLSLATGDAEQPASS